MPASLCYWVLLCFSAHTVCHTKRITLDLKKFKQPDNGDSYYFLMPKDKKQSCIRECVEGDRRICYFNWVFENYAVLSAACGNCTTNEYECSLPQCVPADGFERSILTVNRMLPGPGIHVCRGDRVIIDVTNTMLSRSLTIHWHGVFQENSVYMDGVPFVTQCPVLEESAFRYDFRANNPGTMYWHSHSTLLKLNGLQGSLIIREPKKNEPNSNLYDYDLPAHVLLVLDWTHMEAESRLPGLINSQPTQDTTFYLINGKGRYTLENDTRTTTPYHVFYVKPGMRYRFRLISAVCTQCPARLTIEGHELLIIATDGVAVKPVLVNSIEFSAGERYDFVLTTSKEITAYWIEVRGMQNCFNKDICQHAVLHYKGSSEKLPYTNRPTLETFSFGGVVLNPLNASCGQDQNAICISQLSSAEKVSDRLMKKEPDHNIESTFGFYPPTIEEEFRSGTYMRYLQVEPEIILIPWMNNIQERLPPSPLASQLHDIPRSFFCDNGTYGFTACHQKSREICFCIPIIRIPLGDTVQIVLVDKSFIGGLNHPFHLHGNNFVVLSMGYLPQHLMNARDINELLKHNKLPVNKNPVLKDTLAVPATGYAVIRFIANNPGFWFFHCHFLFHHVSGMGTIIQIGNPSQFPPVPKGFPKCGDYLPPVKVTVDDKNGHEDIYRYGEEKGGTYKN